MTFSSRLADAAGRNRLSIAVDQRRQAGRPIVDLTLSNPTCAGFHYPPGLLAELASPTALEYAPSPLGLAAARQAVADDFSRRGLSLPADRVVLTSSTSEAYSVLFKLLCDPGEAVLAPRPSYPLIEHLTQLDGVGMEYDSLEFHGRWSVDLEGVRETLSSPAGQKVRAIISVSPNNPTGSVLGAAEIDGLAALAADRGLALISDEVFADYAIGAPPESALRQQAALTFVLGGLSKSVGLPQLKLGWIGVGGPSEVVSQAMERLETICDAYLSVSTPVQLAAPSLLRSGAPVRTQIHDRVRENFDRLRAAAATCPACSVLPAEAGWYAVVQVPAIRSEEAIVLDLLERTGILVHPGYFFDFAREAYLVVSLLPEPHVFSAATDTLFQEIGGEQ